MKIKIAAFLMLSAALSFGQTFTRTKPDPEAPSPDLIAQIEAKSAPEHCPMMKDSKSDMSCCAHHQDGSVRSMTCCQAKDGKDAMACMKGDKDKTAASCCAGGECVHTGKAGCCAKSERSTEQAAMGCCGAGAAHCAMHNQRE